jgi:hypothetical protein
MALPSVFDAIYLQETLATRVSKERLGYEEVFVFVGFERAFLFFSLAQSF